MDFTRYAPENSRELSEEELLAMQSFGKEEIKQLATLFPNKPTQAPYLVIKDKNKVKSNYPTVTWHVLYELYKMGQTWWVPISFKNIFYKGGEAKLKVAPVQDLTKEEVIAGVNSPAMKSVKTTPLTSKEAHTPDNPLNEDDDDFDSDVESVTPGMGDDFEDLETEAKSNAEKKSNKKAPLPRQAKKGKN